MLGRVRSAVAQLVGGLGGGGSPRSPQHASPAASASTASSPPVLSEAAGPSVSSAAAAATTTTSSATTTSSSCREGPRGSFSRPSFLQLTPEELLLADDHTGRAVQSPRESRRRLPWSTGYAEVINADQDNQIEQERVTRQATGGCCALTVVYLLGKFYVANAGDSRAIVIRNGEIIPMSREFTPETERQRLQFLGYLRPELLGNEFTYFEFPRRIQQKEVGKKMLYRDQNMNGWAYKRIEEDDLKFPLIYGEGKKVHIYDLTQYEHCPDDVLVLGTDGLWDVTSDQEVATVVTDVLMGYEPNDPCRYTMAAQELVMRSRGVLKDRGWRLANDKLGSGDDISVFVIPLGGPGNYS
ncbi:hypothetical protein E2320_009888 [Naja naja]|nr:hypothetical protein E2320_009888 [Naja naja]